MFASSQCRIYASILMLLLLGTFTARAQTIPMRKPNPYSSPRPFPGQANVPLATTYFIEISPGEKGTQDRIATSTVTVSVTPHDSRPIEMLLPGLVFASGFSGSAALASGWNDTSGMLRIYIKPSKPLPPSTTCTLRVTAETVQGNSLPEKDSTWQFVTESVSAAIPIRFSLNLRSIPVQWTGGFFSGICWGGIIPEIAEGYQKIADVRKKFPRSWNLHRTSTLTGFEFQQSFMPARLPNIVRERETRRITAMKKGSKGIRLMLEDFIGHEQYGIPSNRPVSTDYHPGNVVLIADGVSSTRTQVVAADDATRSILVEPFSDPEDGWKIEYTENAPDAKKLGIPGVFPAGGCYLRKFDPVGTPHYYWARMDQEWDIMWKQYGRKPIPCFDQAPGDLSIDGGPYNTAKDYAQLHEVVRTITSHAIERYGKDCLDLYWTVFNEPDLWTAYWRSNDWIELQKFYDYTTDAILRAFEDHGLDSSKVVIGGLELGAIFGTNMRVREFLYHCSPTTAVMQDGFIQNMVRKSTLLYNAAYADKRLDGKRSRRVEELCRANDGRGAPCDLLSVHCYGGAKLVADKMITAKEIALEIDPEHYKNLRIHTHEACPDWSPPQDMAARDTYLGNGYFETWCAYVAQRFLRRSVEDPRYAFGDSILTFWGMPMTQFGGLNLAFHKTPVDTNGDGRADREDFHLMPIVNYLAMMSSIGPNYYVLPTASVDSHWIGGFASRNGKEIRGMLFNHNETDLQGKSENTFAVSLDLENAGWDKAKVDFYRFDKKNNSFFETAEALRDAPEKPRRAIRRANPAVFANIAATLENGTAAQQVRILKQLQKTGEAPPEIIAHVMRLSFASPDAPVKSAASQLLQQVINPPKAYDIKDIGQLYDAQKIRATSRESVEAEAGGNLRLNAKLKSNETVFFVIKKQRW